MPHKQSSAVLRPLIRTCPRHIAQGRRLASSSNAAPSTIAPAQPQSFLRRYRRALIWSSTSLAIGLTFGTLVSHTISPPPHPEPGTREDAILMHDLETRIEEEFKVKVLRGKCTAAAATLRGDEGVWRELPSDVTKARLLKEALAGARALGVERVFWNEKGKELVAVVWLGGATSGWPGVTHGGCIATVLAEKMGLAARLAKSGVQTELEQGESPESAEVRELEITYKKPTYANAFYVVRMLPRHADEGNNKQGEIEVDGVLETLAGTLCVAISGSVPVSEVKAATAAAANNTASSFGKAKSWIGWPSRSDASQG